MTNNLRDVILRGTTDGTGDLVVDAPGAIKGRLVEIEWIVNAFDSGVDAVISIQSTPSGVAKTLLTLENADANQIYHPRELVHDDEGGELKGTDGGDCIDPVLVGTPRLVVSGGGDTNEGGCILRYYAE